MFDDVIITPICELRMNNRKNVDNSTQFLENMPYFVEASTLFGKFYGVLGIICGVPSAAWRHKGTAWDCLCVTIFRTFLSEKSTKRTCKRNIKVGRGA